MKIQEIEKICKDATSEPWLSISKGEHGRPSVIFDAERKTRHYLYSVSGLPLPDAIFILESRKLMPKLLAVARVAKNLADYSWDGYQEDQRGFWRVSEYAEKGT